MSDCHACGEPIEGRANVVRFVLGAGGTFDALYHFDCSPERFPGENDLLRELGEALARASSQTIQPGDSA